MNTFVVRTHMSENELSRIIRTVDEEGFVDFMEDVVVLSQPMNDSPQILMIHMPKDERMKMTSVPAHVLNWASIDDDQCPYCNAEMHPQETDYMNGYCNRCGLSWTDKEVWFECYTLEDDVAVGQP